MSVYLVVKNWRGDRSPTRQPVRRAGGWTGWRLALLVVLGLTGCRGTVAPVERAAREKLAVTTRAYRPAGQIPPGPVLSTNSTLADLTTYALRHHPQVAAAYADWVGAVNEITVARSLPDPQLTFEMDIADAVTSVMPG